MHSALLLFCGLGMAAATNCSNVIDPEHCKCSDYPSSEMCIEAHDFPQNCIFDEVSSKCVDGFKSCDARTKEQCACRMTTCQGGCGWDCNYEQCYWDVKKNVCSDPQTCVGLSEDACNADGCLWLRSCKLRNPVYPQCIIWGPYKCFAPREAQALTDSSGAPALPPMPKCGCNQTVTENIVV
eukprot:gnl/MRDRNA2_/MRDRNA2_28778_c0_seq2.p1 gnl/MRDRNA2_/MRDRNA2_28778_c0~~gnl/MRDRNA2_/MRDRNA2_28778_c0_seq2.p1  ORF type:complete len:182 (-),score=24.84 gnl/MRDRNA2_/MRDRNA2_28778_c0_seq2:155-700(-)